MLVERLLDAGFTVVVPVNPDLVARRRGPAKKKDDAEDAKIACRIALDRFERLRVLVPHGDQAAELRAIWRDDERASRDERLLNRLRADLIAPFPAALKIAGDDMGGPPFLRLLERWPTATGRSGWLKASRIVGCRSYRPDHTPYPALAVSATEVGDRFVEDGGVVEDGLEAGIALHALGG